MIIKKIKLFIGYLLFQLERLLRSYKSHQISVILGGENRRIDTPYVIAGINNIVMENDVSIGPSFVETPLQKEKHEEIKQNIYRKTAIHRFATIEEVVEAYQFCIDNSFVNGSLIEVNGGYLYK